MKRFRFPFDYKPKVSLKDTIAFANLLKQKLFTYFQERYNAISIDPALVVSNRESSLAYTNNDRYVSFDNKANNLISIFNNCQDNYLTLMSQTLRHKNIYSYNPIIKRDAKLTNTSSMITWNMNLELAMPEDSLNIAFFNKFGKELFQVIKGFVQIPRIKSIFEVSRKKINVKEWRVVEAQKIEDSYRSLTLEQGVNHFCSNNLFVIINNNFKRLRSNNSVEDYVSTSQDLNCSCGFYVYDFINDKAINIINIFKRPSGETSHEQLKTTNPIELDEQVYNPKIFDANRPTNMSVNINFTNLIFYLLDKIHLAEVVSSIWPDDFMDFVKTEKIEIL